MKTIRYPFDLHGNISIDFKRHIKPIFIDTYSNNRADISIDEFAVHSFNYDSESRLLSISLQKAINAIANGENEELINGDELDNNIIKVELVYCLYNAAIISSHISYPLDANSFIESISVSKYLTLHLN
ncbi:hypothetical protein [Photobacterium iliopiscarium]|uniref:hypothetical protein n=1 Tax=Photobacterium iliopiscarium TaxID=56192 RepID=UPI0005D35A15|nr:hypothetical protein [Photobacterium iliopiscarium]KJG11913.1 hypothetical protein UB38_18520 [Photobacterium iliopiscarium]PSU01678.1 hypothetical protein C9I85_00390 [Photobacterium iliopiscarium]PSV83428.1 hypothetical protein C9J51_08995 [Photobacterium iliopiscarium]